MTTDIQTLAGVLHTKAITLRLNKENSLLVLQAQERRITLRAYGSHFTREDQEAVIYFLEKAGIKAIRPSDQSIILQTDYGHYAINAVGKRLIEVAALPAPTQMPVEDKPRIPVSIRALTMTFTSMWGAFIYYVAQVYYDEGFDSIAITVSALFLIWFFAIYFTARDRWMKL